MQKAGLRLLAVLSVTLIAVLAVGQQRPLSPAGRTTLQFPDGKNVVVEYSRPSMRNRKIFGGLVPYGQVWRTGANAATTLKTEADLDIGGASVPKGTYTLYTVPGPDKWTLIINKQTGQWGTEYNQGQDLARVPMKVTQRPSGLETFTISFDQAYGDSATLMMEWENTIASVNMREKK